MSDACIAGTGARVWVTSGRCGLVSSLVVLFLQTVIVTLWARSMNVVMAQDFVSVRLERQGLSVMSVCREIPGTPAVNVSNRGRCPLPAAWLIPRVPAVRAAAGPEQKKTQPLASLEGLGHQLVKFKIAANTREKFKSVSAADPNAIFLTGSGSS